MARFSRFTLPQLMARRESLRRDPIVNQGRPFGMKVVRCAHEMLFSLSIAFLCVSIVFLLAPNLSRPFVHLEISIHRALHLRQADLIRGYLEYSLASAILGLCLAMLLHVSSATRFTKNILRSTSGVLLLLAPAFFWLCYYEAVGWAFGWPYRWAPVELSLAIVCLSLYVLRKWPVPGWVGVLLVACHYAFWYFMPSSNPARADYAGPIAPILGFGSVVVWTLYRARLCEELPPETAMPTSR
jgi:hypothetical protein